MPKRIIISLLFILLTSTIVYSDIIDSIAIVRPILGVDAKDTYSSVATWLENARNEDLSRQFKSRMESGGFGSGFLIRGIDQQMYIVTNFHVIAQADRADIEFQDHDGQSYMYENCPVIIADENKDLAILLLKDVKKQRSLFGLELNTELQVEGSEVWTAGFPGFGAEPLWQLATGSVTNRKARIDELNINGLDYVIQHSSIIDSGSSGGPLLLKDGNNYLVVGVNTWSALGRDNTYFSIPAKDLEELIIRIPAVLNYDTDKKELISALEKTATDFADNFSSEQDDYISHRRFFSHNLVFEKGWKSYFSYRKTLDEKDRDDWDYHFFREYPYDVMKKSVYRDIRNLLHSENVKTSVSLMKIEDSGSISETEPVSVVFSKNGEELHSNWVLEYGKWRISQLSYELADIDSTAENEPEKTSGLIRKIFNFSSISLSPGMPIALSTYNNSALPPEIGFGIDFSFEMIFSSFFSWSIGLGLNTYKYSYVDIYTLLPVSNDINFADINSRIRLQIPFSLFQGEFYLTPFVTGGFGVAINVTNFDSADSSIDSMFFIPLILSGGFEMSAGKLKESLLWGVEITYINYFDPMSFGGFSAGVLDLSILKPSLYVKWAF